MATRFSPLRAVFFDVGGTLLHVRPSVGHVYAEAVRRRGHPADPEGINRSFRMAWKRSLDRRREMDFRTSDAILREEWRRIVSESLDGQAPEEVAAEAFEELYEKFARPEPWSLAEGTIEVVESLRADGLKLGILSNWDSRLYEILAEFGLRRYFDPVVVSYEVGVEKPHPEMFRRAAQEAGVSAEEILMVGDSWDQDISPAIEAGWRAVWVGKESPERSVLPDLHRKGGSPRSGPGSWVQASTPSELLRGIRAQAGDRTDTQRRSRPGKG